MASNTLMQILCVHQSRQIWSSILLSRPLVREAFQRRVCNVRRIKWLQRAISTTSLGCVATPSLPSSTHGEDAASVTDATPALHQAQMPCAASVTDATPGPHAPLRPPTSPTEQSAPGEEEAELVGLSEEDRHRVLGIAASLEEVGVRPVAACRALRRDPRACQVPVHRWRTTAHGLHLHGFRPGQILHLLITCPEALALDQEDLQERLESLRRMLGFRKMAALVPVVTECPALLGITYSEISERLQLLRQWFTDQQLSRLIRSSPQALFTRPAADLRNIYLYVRLRMGVAEPRALVEAAAFEYPLEHIVARHQFLLRAGLYETPDSRGGTRRVRNPHLNHVLASYDRFFLHRVCGKLLKMRHWRTFVAMVEAEGVEKFLDFDSEDSDLAARGVDNLSEGNRAEDGTVDDEEDDLEEDEGWEVKQARDRKRNRKKRTSNKKWQK